MDLKAIFDGVRTAPKIDKYWADRLSSSSSASHQILSRVCVSRGNLNLILFGVHNSILSDWHRDMMIFLSLSLPVVSYCFLFARTGGVSTKHVEAPPFFLKGRPSLATLSFRLLILAVGVAPSRRYFHYCHHEDDAFIYVNNGKWATYLWLGFFATVA